MRTVAVPTPSYVDSNPAPDEYKRPNPSNYSNAEYWALSESEPVASAQPGQHHYYVGSWALCGVCVNPGLPCRFWYPKTKREWLGTSIYDAKTPCQRCFDLEAQRRRDGKGVL